MKRKRFLTALRNDHNSQKKGEVTAAAVLPDVYHCPCVAAAVPFIAKASHSERSEESQTNNQ